MWGAETKWQRLGGVGKGTRLHGHFAWLKAALHPLPCPPHHIIIQGVPHHIGSSLALNYDFRD